ncbi:Arylsulfatase [Roseimaritima multifibrata]|uniref:Arylsulfatase n=1 Tax=Roseimaritima multifibrata TaxID=1930274 RepID=A0A517MLM1_9BACT|nr:sulfatase-like hydrolase/transferase [Roseimaritima multifibrata]QDS95782.1 Arylsulfatase [Roseimaritima multifibrata]
MLPCSPSNFLSRILLATLWGYCTCQGIYAAEPESPNILFIFADDQSFETMAAYGNDEIETPNLDRLAARGTRFSHCYNMGSWSGAVCVASRTMLNSGRFLWQANAIYNESEAEREAGRWWPSHLRQAGYRTYMTGKWHCKANATKSFDVVADVRGGMPQQTPAGYNRPLADQPDPWSPSDPSFGGFWKGGTHWSEVVGNHATEFLATASKRSEPFFMYVAFNAPHDPRQSPQEYVDKYPAAEIAIPKNFLPIYPYCEEMGAGRSLRDEKLAPFPRTTHAVQVQRQEYYAIITHMDVQIGRILDALKASGKEDNTWIIFTADHGLAVGQHGLMGKQNLYDHSTRVPFIVIGPDVPANETIDTPIYLQDVMPTTLELAGTPRPAHVQFNSLLPILRGEGEGAYPAIYGAYLNRQRSIRTESAKLILYPQAGVARLYDMKADPLEQNDLAGNPDSLPLMRTLFAQLQDLQADYQDPLKLEETFPRLAP